MTACDDWKALFLEGREKLSPQQQEGLFVHIATCPGCREQYTVTQHMITSLRRAEASVQPPEMEQRLQQLMIQYAKREQRQAMQDPQTEPIPLVVQEEPGERMANTAVILRPQRAVPPHIFAHRQKRQKSPWLQRFLTEYALVASFIIVALLVCLFASAASAASGLPLSPSSASEPHYSFSLLGSLQAPRDYTISVQIRQTAWVHTVAWSPKGDSIALLWSDSAMQVWSVKEQRELFHVKVGWGEGLAFSPNGKYLATIDDDTTAQILDLDQCTANPDHCTPVRVYTGHSAPIAAIAWSPDSRDVATASEDKTIQIWDAFSGQQRAVFRDTSYSTVAERGKFTAMAWSPDGTRLVSGDENGHVQIWNVSHVQTWDASLTSQSKPIMSYAKQVDDPITSVNWSPDGTEIISAGYRGIAFIWNARTGDTIAQIPDNGDTRAPNSLNTPIFAAVWSPVPGQNRIALASYNQIQVYHVNGRQVEPLANYPLSQQTSGGIFTIAWSPDGTQLVSGGQGVVLKLTLSSQEDGQ